MTSLQEARRDRDEVVARMAEEDEAASNRENRRGLAENIEEGAEALVGAVTGTTKERVQEASDKARETKDAAKERAGEMKDRAKEKMEDTKETASKAKDRSTAKVMDYEDTSEGKGSTTKKLEEYKESAAEAARKARELLIESKEGARVKLAGDQAKDRLGETRESARKQLEDVKQRAASREEEDQQRKLKETDEADKGRSATENIYGAFPSITESIKTKMALPKDVVEQKKGGRGDDEVRDNKEKSEKETEDEDDVMLRAKEADQMTGTGFTDPGKMGEEGTGIQG